MKKRPPLQSLFEFNTLFVARRYIYLWLCATSVSFSLWLEYSPLAKRGRSALLFTLLHTAFI